MRKLAQRVVSISPSPTLEIDTRIKELVSQGDSSIINLSVGEPDVSTPVRAAYSAIEGITSGFTKYTNAIGIIELRKQLSIKLKNENHLNYTPDQIIVTVGGKHALYNAFMAICEDGDEVIIPAPYWVTYPEQVKLSGAEPIFIHTDESTGFKITPAMLENAITPKTKALLINSPSNPTGATYTYEELKQLADVISKYDFYVISDEIYEKMSYLDEPYKSFATISEDMKNRTILINGFSKTYGMTGWRLGYLAAPQDVAKAIANFQSHVTANVTSVAQLAAIGALEYFDNSQITKFQERLEYVYSRIQKMPLISCAKPEGAFYVFPNVKDTFGKQYKGTTINNADSLCQLILEHASIGIVPGTGFGANDNIRISCAVDITILEKAMDRLQDFLSNLS